MGVAVDGAGADPPFTQLDNWVLTNTRATTTTNASAPPPSHQPSLRDFFIFGSPSAGTVWVSTMVVDAGTSFAAVIGCSGSPAGMTLVGASETAKGSGT